MSCLDTHSCFDNLVCSWVVVSWAVRQPSTVKRVLNSVPLHPAIPVIHAASSWRKWKAPIMWQWPKPDGLGQHLGGEVSSNLNYSVILWTTRNSPVCWSLTTLLAEGRASLRWRVFNSPTPSRVMRERRRWWWWWYILQDGDITLENDVWY